METRILITDLTAMQGDRVCIAGVDGNLQNIRPVLPQPGVLHDHLFYRNRVIVRPRAVLRLQLDPSINAEMPHVEDYDWHDPVPPTSLEYLMEEARWRQILQRLAKESPQPLFGTGLKSHKDARNRKLKSSKATFSLTTIDVDQIYFFDCQQDVFEKGKYRYRLSFRDDRQNSYDDIPVTDLALQAWAVAQIRRGANPQTLSDWLSTQLQDAQQVFLRLGLGREFRREFWLQVNGIYSFPDWLGGRCFADFDAARA